MVVEAALADETLTWERPREGRRVALLEDTLERRGPGGEALTLRRARPGG
ncbi:hypothetical protein [Sediminicurvatus halobius]|nr:hypothetical protein [Spiribacter halobius]UEX77304.1 hypothetical protein LMH63_15350 [Spiribacter halobius]